ncbi:MAG: peptidylprolyl isomerase [Burkholderiales bacterium]|nr:peptidylprolyl isomerase [Burkholderiales bacterium]
MQTSTPAVASVNGFALHAEAEVLDDARLRQRACTELLRQEAQHRGLLDPADAPASDGVPSEAADAAIEALLDADVRVVEPDEDACRRHFAAHQAAWRQGDRALVSHILFAVTPGVDVAALRRRAEASLVELRCGDEAAFAAAARELSNCPSGAEGGALGWLARTDCAPEFAHAVFDGAEVGVFSRLVATRFGFHVVAVRQRDPGKVPAFEDVHGAVAQALRAQAYASALRQYLQVLAGKARLEGVSLDAATTPLTQ